MTSTTVKRSQFKSFLNVVPAGPADYRLIGDGVTSGKVTYNPKTTEETYIHEDSATISVDSYAPTMPLEATAKAGDEVFDFIDALRQTRATLDSAKTDVVNVWLYETPVAGAYPAEKQFVAVAVNEFGGDGGQSTKINYTLNYLGVPTAGMFNPTTRAFTPN